MTPLEFEQRWHQKRVRLLGTHYQLPDTTYVVTAALYQHEANDVTILAIKSERYTPDNKEWYTIRIGADEFHKCMADFEVVE